MQRLYAKWDNKSIREAEEEWAEQWKVSILAILFVLQATNSVITGTSRATFSAQEQIKGGP